MPDRKAQRLLDLLEVEHAAITEGDFAALPGIGTKKETIFTALTDADLTHDTAKRLSDVTHRNQTLLQAAMRGVKAAAQTFEAVQSASKGGLFYGSDGTVSRLSGGDQRLSQKL